jgi:hypothetical protein
VHVQNVNENAHLVTVDEVYSRLAQQIGTAQVEKDKIQEELDHLEDEELTHKEEIKKRREKLRVQH